MLANVLLHHPRASDKDKSKEELEKVRGELRIYHYLLRDALINASHSAGVQIQILHSVRACCDTLC